MHQNKSLYTVQSKKIIIIIISMVYNDGENKGYNDSNSSGKETRTQDPSLCEKGNPSLEGRRGQVQLVLVALRRPLNTTH